MSGWNNSDRKERLPDDWPALRAATKKRAGGRCEKRLPSGKRCPRPGTDCDHRQPGDDHRLSNLQWLCPDHHKAKTAAEAKVAQRAKKALTRRPPEQHPGLGLSL